MNPTTKELYSYRSRRDFPPADLETLLLRPTARNVLLEDLETASAGTKLARASFATPPRLSDEKVMIRRKSRAIAKMAKSFLPEPPRLRSKPTSRPTSLTLGGFL
ncbi:hypothetical protein EJ05DRAFT_481101 [Pseudovirgaria hyperparasitica]|uniref:Uncharacterized protein n=1 Tax=Pseudovirgaria hyperparasitica TaxID=470096 RepID=A0A6A6VRZ3_9PEZI|nr:uncharacterized protein EJ05DRAFT_481101 [Pseudovirgaria hyperparasitica]KAF2752679.1 hypothetical protein EJ05DRAFT_481101 [Pseudovirgaria hyperparasitica]